MTCKINEERENIGVRKNGCKKVEMKIHVITKKNKKNIKLN
jgi:hypothetical protein